MSRWQKPKADTDRRIRDLEKRLERKERVPQYTSSPANPPLPPATPTVTFSVKEKQTHAVYRAVVTWPAGSANTCQADVDYYVVELQPTNAAGVPKANGKTQRINVKGTDDPLDANFTTIPNPKDWYYRARVKLVDKAHQESAFSSYSTPLLPFDEADPLAPTPTGLAVDYTRQGRQRNTDRVKANVYWDEIGQWDIPGFDKEPDVAQYHVEMAFTDSAGVILQDSGGRDIVRSKTVRAKKGDGGSTGTCIFENLNKQQYYKFRIRAVDRFHRKGDWSTYTPHSTPTDNTPPPPPTSVTAFKTIAAVGVTWLAPVQAPPDDDIWDIDVAYFQVQLATKANFQSSSIIKKDRYVNVEEKQFPTKEYRKRYWLRVRSVDAAGNTSAWVEATGDPVSPLKGETNRKKGSVTEPDIEYLNDIGVPTGGGGNNRGYQVSGTTGTYAAVVEGEEANGILFGELQLSRTDNRADSGFIFRGIDNSNYLFVRLRKTGTVANDAIELCKREGGTVTVLASVTTAGLLEEQIYDLKIEVPSSHQIKVYLDTVLKITHTLSAGDQTTFGTATKVGLWQDRSGTLDDGLSRFGLIQWKLDSTGEYAVNDIFERDPSVSSLGEAASGQVWSALSGTWGISEDGHSGAFFGAGMIVPVFYGENQNSLASVNIPNSGTPRLVGEGGAGAALSNPAIEFEIDRPVRLLVDAAANIMNESATDFNALFFIVAYDGSNPYVTGVATRQYCQNNDAQGGNIRRRLLVNQRELFYVPTGPTATIQLFWGYRNSSDASRNVTLTNQKMKVWVGYAPDLFGSRWTITDPAGTVKHSRWTKSRKNRRRYKSLESNE